MASSEENAEIEAQIPHYKTPEESVTDFFW